MLDAGRYWGSLRADVVVDMAVDVVVGMMADDTAVGTAVGTAVDMVEEERHCKRARMVPQLPGEHR